MRKAIFGMLISTLVILNVLVVTVIMKQNNDAEEAQLAARLVQATSTKEVNKTATDSSAVNDKENDAQENKQNENKEKNESESESLEEKKEKKNEKNVEENEPINEKEVTITTKNDRAIEKPELEEATGSITGVITWQFNDVIGTKPDVGAQIALVKPNPKEKYNVPLFEGSESGTLVHGNGVYEAKADGYGSYIINDIPEGRYLYIINSNKTYSGFKISQEVSDLINQLLTEEHAENSIRALKEKKYAIGYVDIKHDKTVTISHDFGYTEY